MHIVVLFMPQLNYGVFMCSREALKYTGIAVLYLVIVEQLPYTHERPENRSK